MLPGDAYPLIAALWPADALTQLALGFVALSGLLATGLVIWPIARRLRRARNLVKQLRDLASDHGEGRAVEREEFADILRSSVVSTQWAEFERRWHDVSSAAGSDGRTPLRFGEVLAEQPLVPYGVRRALLGALPGTFIALGVLGTFIGLTIATTQLGAVETVPNAGSAIASDTSPSASTSSPTIAQSADRASKVVTQLTSNLGLAFRTSVLGLLLSIFFSLVFRAIEGSSHRRECDLEREVERLYPPVTEAEVAALGQRQQADLFGSLKNSLTDLMTEYQELSRAGFENVLQSLEQVTSNVSEKQRAAIDQVARSLNDSLREGIGTYLGELRSALEQAVSQQQGLSLRLEQAFDRIDSSIAASGEAASQLTTAAQAVGGASGALETCTGNLLPALENLDSASQSLERTAGSVAESQHAAAQTVDEVGKALVQAQGSLDQQRQMVESSLGELRASISELSQGLADDLVQALERIDGLMESALGRLSGTVGESNETLDRLARPLGELDDAVDRVSRSIERSGQHVASLGDRLDGRLSEVAALGSALESYAAAQTAAYGSSQDLLKQAEQRRSEISDLGQRLAEQAAAHSAEKEELKKLAERLTEAIVSISEQRKNTMNVPDDVAMGQLSTAISRLLEASGRWLDPGHTPPGQLAPAPPVTSPAETRTRTRPVTEHGPARIDSDAERNSRQPIGTRSSEKRPTAAQPAPPSPATQSSAPTASDPRGGRPSPTASRPHSGQAPEMTTTTANPTGAVDAPSGRDPVTSADQPDAEQKPKRRRSLRERFWGRS